MTLKANREHEFGGKTIRPVNHRFTNFRDGKLVIADGNLIHLYDPRTAEWFEINTLDDR